MRFLLDHSLGGALLAKTLRECCKTSRFPGLEILTVHDVYEIGLRPESDDQPWFAWCGRQQPRVFMLSRDYRSYLGKELVRQALSASGIHFFVMGKLWGNASFHNVVGRLLVLWDSIWEHAADTTPHLHELTYSKLSVERICPTGYVKTGQRLKHS